MRLAAPPGDPSPASLRAVLDSVFATPDFRWADDPPLARLARQWWTALLDWLRALQHGNPAAFRLVLFALVGVLVLLLAHGAWIVWRTIRSGTVAAEGHPPPPPAAPRDAEWYLRAADQAAAAGRTAEALQLAFVGLALRLDDRGILHYQPSKTPAECARDARLAGSDRERLHGLVRTLYAHAFGGRPLSGAEYGHWRADLGGPWPELPDAPAH